MRGHRWEERNLTKKNAINTIADKELTSVLVCVGRVGKIANISCNVMLTLTLRPLISHIVLVLPWTVPYGANVVCLN